MNDNLTFLHSGDMGDIISSLHSIKQLYDKTKKKAILYLDITGGMTCNNSDLNTSIKNSTYAHGLRFNETSYNFLKPLIEIQPYIERVEQWNPGITVDYNLNYFRFPSMLGIKHNATNLLHLHQVVCKLPVGYIGPWLFCPKKEFSKKIIVVRSCRYQSCSLFYRHNYKQLRDKAFFLGTDLEYRAFTEEVRFPPAKYTVKDSLEAAILINSSDLIYTNATLFYWIAAGLGKNIIHEVALGISNTCFKNCAPNIRYMQGGKQITL